MKRLLIYVCVFFLGISYSCKMSFDPELDNINSPLVVEGLISDEVKPYTIRLNKASQFNGKSDYKGVTNAKVLVSDNDGYTYKFTETTAGVYVSNPSEFVGIPRRIYTLTIETLDKSVYKSKPQTLLPNNLPVTTYAEFGIKDQLVDNGNESPYLETVKGINLLVDIKNSSDTLPHFRFEHKTYREYTYTIQVNTLLSYIFYGWQFLEDNNLVNITDEQYQTSSKNIEKHAICFIPTAYTYETSYLDSTTKEVKAESARVTEQIVKMTQYRLNSETYQFYKDVNNLLAANGKVFDPIAFQFKGNIQCTSNSQLLALGFFEASSGSTNYYAIPPGRKVVSKINSFEPPSSSGCIVTISSLEPPIVSIPPDFWVY